MKRAIVALAAAGVVSACAAQPNAGLTKWHIEFDPATGKPVVVDIVDGREKASVSFEADMTTGRASYQATDVRAFDAFAIQAEVSKKWADTFGETMTPEMLGTVVAALRAAGVPLQ